MKTLHFSIILSLMILSIVSYVEAKPYMSDEDLFNASQFVLVGKIISKNTNFTPGYISYEIKVEKSLKNTQQNNVITAVGHNLSGGLLGNTIFEVGDTGRFYLNNYGQKYDNDSSWFISVYSYKIDSSLEQQIELAKLEGECLGLPGACPAERKLIEEKQDRQNLILISAIGIPSLAVAVGVVVCNKKKHSKF
ncbi:MAG: hypothetical protein ACRD92_02640 [Nitrosopumilaceae archaeon]